jgi:protein-tyrosine-phosphatase
MMKSTHILAVCTGNICRSPIAEGILRKALEDAAGVLSAGTHALEGNSASEFAVITARENGIDISGHRARMLTPGMVRSNDFILCMESFHVQRVLELDASACRKVFNLAAFSGAGKMEEITDPYGCGLRDYRECFRDIERCIHGFLDSKVFPGIKR